MPEPTVTMPADQIAGAITFLTIAVVLLLVLTAIQTVIDLSDKPKRRR